MLPGGLTRVALPRGQPGRELQPGRRLQGHLGARRRGRTWCRRGPHADAAAGAAAGGRRSRPRTAAPAAASTAAAAAAGEVPVLSRIAESLYWIGRYVERAEDTARILDVHLHRMLEDPWTDEDAACRSLLAVMGMADDDGPVTSTRRVDLLGLDAAIPARSSARWPRPARTPAAPARPSRGDVGVPELDLARPAARGSRPPGSSARRRSSAGSGSARRCSPGSPTPRMSRDDGGVPGAGPQRRAGRHDRSAARGDGGHAARHAAGRHAAGVLGARGLPADATARRRRRLVPSSCCWTGSSRARSSMPSSSESRP